MVVAATKVTIAARTDVADWMLLRAFTSAVPECAET
jgi:hypothetical protein